MKVKLGQKVRDKLTGLEGAAIARTEWLYGCVRIVIQPFGEKDGKPFETFVVDEPQCELVKAEKAKGSKESRHGDRTDVERRVDPV